jgi:hypothetical protein
LNFEFRDCQGVRAASIGMLKAMDSRKAAADAAAEAPGSEEY